MRRRRPKLDPADEPPARLRAYDEAEWLPLVDVTEYDPEHYRCICDRVPYGEPYLSFENWRRQEAWSLWTRARHDWFDVHGWPGGLDIIGLFQQEHQMHLRFLVGQADRHDD